MIVLIKDGVNVLSKFNASKEETLLRYQKLIPEIKDAWDKNPLNTDLESGLNKLPDLTK